MTSTSKIQLRGHCQLCGHEHAATRGTIAAHGYTVEHGYFHGICNGDRHEPLELDRAFADKVCAKVRADAIGLDAHALALRAGTEKPATVPTERYESDPVTGKRERVRIPFDQAPPYKQQQEIERAATACERQAEMARDFATTLAGLADKFHGQPLREVEREAGPAPILAGEQRTSKRGVLTVTRTDRGRVYWRDARGLNGWTGSQAWRRMESAT